jgi:hypothetical protein
VRQRKTRRDERRGRKRPDGRVRSLLGSSSVHQPTDVEEIVGYHAEPDPPLHSDLSLVPVAVEPMSPFDHADASLPSGAPFLAVAALRPR